VGCLGEDMNYNEFLHTIKQPSLFDLLEQEAV